MKFKVFVFMALALFQGYATAGSAEPGVFKTLHFMRDGTVIVYTTGVRSDVPDCASIPSRFVFDASTENGKAQLSGVLAAYATKQPVRIFGTGTCSLISDTEKLSYFYYVDQ